MPKTTEALDQQQGTTTGYDHNIDINNQQAEVRRPKRLISELLGRRQFPLNVPQKTTKNATNTTTTKLINEKKKRKLQKKKET